MGSHAHVLLPQSWCVSAAASPMALSFASRLMGGRKAARKEQRSDDADSALQEARTTLIDMGFEAADADRALDSTNGDLAEAVAQLLHIENGSRYSVLAASSSEEAPAADAGEEASVSAEADADIMEAIRRSQEEDEERRRKEVADREMFEAALAASLGEIQEGTPKGIRRTELDQKLEDAKDQLADIYGDRRAMNPEADGAKLCLKRDEAQELLELGDRPEETGTDASPELTAMPPSAPARPNDVLPPVGTPQMSRSAAVSSLRGFGSDLEMDDILGWPSSGRHGGRNSGSRGGSSGGGSQAGGSRGGGSRSGRSGGGSHGGSRSGARSSSTSALRPPGPPLHHQTGREHFYHDTSGDPLRHFSEASIESIRSPGGRTAMEAQGQLYGQGFDRPRVSTPTNEQIVGLEDLEGWSTTTVMRPCLLPSLKAPPISPSHLSGSRPITRPNSTTRVNTLSGSSSAPLLAASSAILSTPSRRKPDVDPWGR